MNMLHNYLNTHIIKYNSFSEDTYDFINYLDKYYYSNTYPQLDNEYQTSIIERVDDNVVTQTFKFNKNSVHERIYNNINNYILNGIKGLFFNTDKSVNSNYIGEMHKCIKLYNETIKVYNELESRTILNKRDQIINSNNIRTLYMTNVDDTDSIILHLSTNDIFKLIDIDIVCR